MRYIISDIHGCYEEYRELLAKINFSPNDELYVLEDALVYEVLEDKGRKFVLVHAGIRNFDEDKELYEYDFHDFIFERPDYSKRYYRDDKTFVVTGHTPTFFINPNRNTDVYQGYGHIALDCGCVFGGKLAAYCIETGEITYVQSRNT